MCALEVDAVTMAYGRRALFADLSLRVAAGEILVVTGANGAGKSTLLKVIAGLARPESGQVRRPALGYAAPDVQLYAELTGDENLQFAARLRGLSSDGAADLLARVGLPRGRGRDRVAAYSSGMRQRLKLALSLLGAPPLLVWDEPTATLDPAGAACVERILDEQTRAGGSAVVATNDAGEAERWAAVGQRVHVGPP